MSDIDVEVVDSLEAAVNAPRYVLYGGKGGVGKTTMAAATALASANDGTATLAVSTDPAHSLSDALDTDVPPEPVQLREDIPLYGAEIDPDAATQSAFEGALGGLPDGVNPLGGTMPGADEAAAMQLLLQYMDDERFERVVIDTAPTGHTLRLLELPDLMDSMMGRLLAFREQLSGLAGSLGGLFGGKEDNAEEGLDNLQALSDRIERLREELRDPARTDFRVVMVPEEMSVRETERLLARLQEFEVPVETLIVNRVMQPLADVAGVDPDWFVEPDLADCAFCQRRAEVQTDALHRASDTFHNREVKRVPLFAEEVRGEAMLRVVAACLD